MVVDRGLRARRPGHRPDAHLAVTVKKIARVATRVALQIEPVEEIGARDELFEDSTSARQVGSRELLGKPAESLQRQEGVRTRRGEHGAPFLQQDRNEFTAGFWKWIAISPPNTTGSEKIFRLRPVLVITVS